MDGTDQILRGMIANRMCFDSLLPGSPNLFKARDEKGVVFSVLMSAEPIPGKGIPEGP